MRSWYESIADSNIYELLIIYRLYYPIIYRSYPKLLEKTGSLFLLVISPIKKWVNGKRLERHVVDLTLIIVIEASSKLDKDRVMNKK